MVTDLVKTAGELLLVVVLGAEILLVTNAIQAGNEQENNHIVPADSIQSGQRALL